ncbi:MAG: helix-turn-helix domain-containing protein [Lewinellaceae bacterium]|nr:helix-turn-helix domain-containing protein [Lewinellaceae bacterium]
MKRKSPEEKEKILKEIEKLGIVEGCRKFGISATTYYDWDRRYKSNGLSGLKNYTRHNEADVKRLVKEKYDSENNSAELIKYEYFDNGRLKRRLIERIPEPKIKGVYTGGPSSDDEFYKYNFDSEGRIKVFYRIINGKKYKIAVFSYEKNS